MPAPLFEVTAHDRQVYAERIRDFLPAAVVDIHTHLWRPEHKSGRTNRAVSWPGRVASESLIEQLVETYKLLLPDKTVTPLLFASSLSPRDDLRAGNDYVARSAAAHGFPALVFSRPAWTAAELEANLDAGGFLGAKSYLTLAEEYLPEKEIRIFDFFPRHQLEVLDRRGAILMLHVPRDGRLRDPVNLAQLLEIDRAYSRLQVIVAHVGRAYCPEDVGNAFDILAPARRLLFDISANTNADTFRCLIRAVGPRRILFGSDLPITRMRMRRVCEAGNYVNIVPRGLYGDVSGDRHMREADGAEADRLTFFFYEEIEAFRQAAEAEGLSAADVADVFLHNANRVLAAARQGAGRTPPAREPRP
jgi:predicted TIM-barrel fold metal-dependent hydrolase